jgi:hypothetical protein
MHKQYDDLQDKCNKISLLFTQSYFNARDSEQGFLTTTSLSEKKLQTIQQPVINSVLSRLGYNRNMPRSIIHFSTIYGGVGLIDLCTEQGCSKIQMNLTHLRLQRYLQNQIGCVLQSYTTLTGLTTSLLMSTDVISYVRSPWVDTLRQFLSKLNAKILIPKFKHINLIRKFDKPIINPKYINQFLKSDQEMINACRLYLQVNTIAEISNHQGSRILECVFNFEVVNEIPTVWTYSKSSLTWPYQEHLPRKALKLWKKFLSLQTSEDRYLHVKLGPWYDNVHSQRKWTFLSQGNRIHRTRFHQHTKYSNQHSHALGTNVNSTYPTHSIMKLKLAIYPSHHTI